MYKPNRTARFKHNSRLKETGLVIYSLNINTIITITIIIIITTINKIERYQNKNNDWHCCNALRNYGLIPVQLYLKQQ